MGKWILKLYVAGESPRSMTAIANLRRICEQELSGRYEMVVVNVLEQPEVVKEEQIVALPTLIKELPPPLRRLIGDLSKTDDVLRGLDIVPGSAGG